jgi:phosphatidylinositol 4-phosphatase
VLEPSHTIFGIKGTLAIPLSEESARITLNTLASRNADLARPSLIAARSGTLDTISDARAMELNEVETTSGASTPRVKFATEDHVKLMTPRAEGFGATEGENPPSPSESTNSLASSIESLNTSSVAKAIADKLSFWPRLSKRTSASAEPDAGGETEGLVSSHDEGTLESDIDEGNVDPNEAIGTILDKTAPPPATAAEKHSQLEDKILKETIQQFSKGNMYFAYTHGKCLPCLS